MTDKKTLKRSLFLEAARKIFAQKGFQATNVSDIVAEVNSGQGTFYYHFNDKQAIFDELMNEFFDKLINVLIDNERNGVGRHALDDRDLAINNAMNIASVFFENIDLATVYFRESKYISGEAVKKMEFFYSVIYNQLENSLKEGIEYGFVRPEADPKIASRCFIGAVENVIYNIIRSGEPFDMRETCEQIVDFQFFGLLKRRKI